MASSESESIHAKLQEISLPFAFAESHSVRCRACGKPAPDEDTTEGDSKENFTSGHRCLSCPLWYSCCSCTQEAISHSKSGIDHVTYCVASEDERAAAASASSTPYISPWLFVIWSLLWPFIQMFVPSVSLYVQAYLSAVNAKCSTARNGARPEDVSRAELSAILVGNILLPLVYILGLCIRISTNVCVEVLIFEKMLASSVFVDCRMPNFTSSATYKLWIAAFGFIVIYYFSLSTAAISLSSSTTNTEIQYALRIIANNILALSGGVYFIYTMFVEGALLGRSSAFSLPERSPDTITKLSKMKVVAMPQLMLAAKASVCAVHIAQRGGHNSVTPGQMERLLRRLSSPVHLAALVSHLSEQNVDALEAAAFGHKRQLSSLRAMINPKKWLVRYLSISTHSALPYALVTRPLIASRIILSVSVLLLLCVSFIFTIELLRPNEFSQGTLCHR